MSVKLKFCGLRRKCDISFANETKPDYIGFIFAPSKRMISCKEAKELKKDLNPQIKAVGVFVDCPIEQLADYDDVADIFQFHGHENEEYIAEVRKRFSDKEIWKAARLRNFSDIENVAFLDADKYVLDAFSKAAYGGTGRRIDAQLLEEAVSILTKPLFIAGGIGSDNISETIRNIKPYGIDLSSSIETGGFKDLNKMNEIITILREENLR
ncbi:MAG: phosphoribosylanthranilate isomerase [Oscillospiraceae bacterium]|nr:phosphoribosylanthranilate isomerase [Oscillospiraceae bacterium]